MRSIATKFVALALALTFVSSVNVTEAHAVESPKQDTNQVVHTVVSGDTLDKIAKTNGTDYLRLFYANTDISNPDLILVDQKIRIPNADEKLAERPLPSVAPAPVVSAAPQAVVSAPAPRIAAPQTSNAPAVAGGSVWDALAQCESGGNWAINTGNGFYGGLQFTLSSWQAVGGSGMPNEASREEQIMRGQMLQAIQGWGAWPACTAKLGIR